ncbi:MAG: tRNA epoxyqueuosine(34) reductase QueG [Bacteroidales bacterium]
MNYIPIDLVKDLAKKEGFCDCGAAKCERMDLTLFKDWIARGYHGSMSYLERNFDKRENPELLFENTKTIFCFLMSYNDEIVDKKYNFKIASYAQRRDYHYTIKQKLNNIIIQLKLQFPGLQAKAFVDTAPIKEREWAIKSGLGWKGKNSLLVTKEFGNKIFISEILCNYISDYSKEIANYCGNCNRCIDSCPNRAILTNGNVNANLCISYQTIENKGSIPEKIDLKNYVYGCDICVNACIWNRKAKKEEIQDLDVKNVIRNVLSKIETEEDFKKDFQKLRKMSPMDRIKYSKFVSNVEIVKKQLNQ